MTCAADDDINYISGRIRVFKHSFTCSCKLFRSSSFWEDLEALRYGVCLMCISLFLSWMKIPEKNRKVSKTRSRDWNCFEFVSTTKGLKSTVDVFVDVCFSESVHIYGWV